MGLVANQMLIKAIYKIIEKVKGDKADNHGCEHINLKDKPELKEESGRMV